MVSEPNGTILPRAMLHLTVPIQRRLTKRLYRIIAPALLASGLLTAAVLFGSPIGGVAQASCSPNDRIDSSTAGGAAQKMQAAGFSGVHDLKKGCDNYWHGIATQNGTAVRVVLAPQGTVMREND